VNLAREAKRGDDFLFYESRFFVVSLQRPNSSREFFSDLEDLATKRRKPFGSLRKVFAVAADFFSGP